MVQHIASLDERSVQQIATGEVSALTPRRRRTRTQPVTRRYKAQPDVWRKALRLAGGDPRRLLVRSWTVVSVLNHPQEKP